MNTAGSYSYDTNNNMTGTKKLDAYRTISGTNYKIVFRAQWTFSFDRKNRLRTHTYAGGSNVRGNIWYDGAGRVWQRWNDDSVSGDWDETLMRYVYDGNTLAQEHQFLASGNGMWIYNYVRYDRDYLHGPSGMRQRSYVGPTSYTDEFLFRDMADIAAKVPRGSSVSVTRAPRMASGERTPENDLAPSTSSFTDISRLGAHGAFTESYGGGTTNPRTQGFDALLQIGKRHHLPGLGRFVSMRGNNPFVAGRPLGERRTVGESQEWPGFPIYQGGSGPQLPPASDECLCAYAMEWEAYACSDCPECTLPVAARANDWFDLCCEPNCNYLKGATVDVCGVSSFLSDCACERCKWSFGLAGGSWNVTVVDCPSSEAMKAFLYTACQAAAHCACAMRWNAEWQAQMESDLHGHQSSWKGAWGCISRICREGGITIRCSQPVPNGDKYQQICSQGFEGYTFADEPNAILICLGGAQCWPASILHELLHLCGVGIEGTEVQWNQWQAVRSLPRPSWNALSQHFCFDYKTCQPKTNLWWEQGCQPCGCDYAESSGRVVDPCF